MAWIALPLVFGLAAASDCLERGVAYTHLADITEDVVNNKLTQQPNAGYVDNAKACAESCRLSPTCNRFTFKARSYPGGACFLIGSVEALAHRYESPHTVSALKSCNFTDDIPAGKVFPPTPVAPIVKPITLPAPLPPAAAAATATAATAAAVGGAAAAAEDTAAAATDAAATAASTAADDAATAATDAAKAVSDTAATAADGAATAATAAGAAATGAVAAAVATPVPLAATPELATVAPMKSVDPVEPVLPAAPVIATLAPATAAASLATPAPLEAAPTVAVAASPIPLATVAPLKLETPAPALQPPALKAKEVGAETAEVIADASCFKTGTAIKDSLVPAPIAWTATASECQTKCKESPDCGHFSWKEDTLPKGGCWLLPEATTEEADEKAVSGPKDCPEFEALGGAGPVGAGGGMDSNMLVAILGGTAAAAALGGLAAYASQSEQKKQKKKRSIRVADEEAPMTGAAAVAPSPSYAPVMSAVPVTSTPMTYQVAQPVTYTYTQAPQVTYTQAPQAPQVVYS